MCACELCECVCVCVCECVSVCVSECVCVGDKLTLSKAGPAMQQEGSH